MSTVDFELHRLGWKAFEDFTGCVLSHVLGQTYQQFSVGPDGGRDGAFLGEWSSISGEAFTGTFTVQCKHTSKKDKEFTEAILTPELPKISRLVSKGLATNYFLVTNYTVSAGAAAEAERKVRQLGVEKCKVFGYEWLIKKIAGTPQLRRMVPRLYGLGDLTQIVTHQAYRQAREVLDSQLPDLKCFVPTSAYRKSAKALSEHGFTLLIGEPASGKTTIANLMALSAADEWNLQTVIISSPQDFSKFWNPDDPGQFFWVDDAFGATQYDSARVQEWNARLPLLQAARKMGARIVFTSRDYVFRAAKKDLKIGAFPLFNDAQVTILVEDLSDAEKKLILYNHLKCGDQPQTFKRSVKSWLPMAARTNKFLPEIARRFANPAFTKQLQISKNSVKQFFERPLDWLGGVLQELASGELAALALVFIAGGRLAAPISETLETQKTIDTLGVSVGEIKAGLNALNGSFLILAKEPTGQFWQFRHPTVRDAFATLVGNNPEWIDIYLAGVSTERLIGEVTCGDIGLEGVKIIVPKLLFLNIIARLKSFKIAETMLFFNPKSDFLAYRCSAEFLQDYYAETGELEKLPKSIMSLKSGDNSARILTRLFDADALPEAIRAQSAQKLSALAEINVSIEFLTSGVGKLLTPEESEEIVRSVTSKVLTERELIIEAIRDSWDNSSDPVLEFSNLTEILDNAEEDADEETQKIINRLRWDIDDAVAEMEENIKETSDYGGLDAESASADGESEVENIFDDVDE